MGPERFDIALRQYVEAIRDNEIVDGVLIAGSCSTGTPGPYSDLDLQILLTSQSADFPPWSARMVDGVELEIFTDTFEDYQAAIEKGKDIRGTLYPLAMGRILFDKRGRFAQLKRQAEAAIHDLSARIAPTAELKRSAARPLIFGFRKLGNAKRRNDPIAFEFEYGFLLHLFPVQALAAAGFRIAPNPVADLQRLLPQMHPLFQKCLLATTMEEKWLRLEDLMKYAFAELALEDFPEPVF